ncbi:oxidoreductase [Cytophagaceae bacterium DM2B3-1]|uniref:Oxidoreductase n=1 Tax=Xanthocytophaga flava TaxID=3048013 RepID=A0ABT7CDU0_9BACT|nr:oxidoreductase [Xanthocytophaga flavus]MDJ1473178.1 oxidoreductase [Xanthocytophaga flavus]MDJ1491802.1 oxidoreductase [Xanthocytophaga flavus]
MNKIIQVGMAAYGMSGKVFHGPLLKSLGGFWLKKIVERTSEKSKTDFPETVRVKTWDEILFDQNIELVVVNTPNAHHFEMCKQALQANKHVVVEKPFTVTKEEARKLIELAKQQNRVLTVFQNRRWDGDFLTVQQVVKQNLLGKLVEFEGHYDRYRNYVEANTWKEETGPGSGILYNLGSHMIDQALVLFGMPQAVTAELRAQRPGSSIDDSYHLILHYSDIRVILKSSYLVREQGPRYILHGTDGSFLKWGIDPQEDALKAGRLPLEPNWGAEPESEWGVLNTTYNGLHYKSKIETLAGNYRHFYENVYDAIVHNAPLDVKPEEALQIIQIIEAAYQSHQEKRTIDL